MDIKSPRTFETSDKAHADLFNEMVKVLLENDSGLLDQLLNHMNDMKPHVSESDKQKWNESQLYKMTADNGMQLINVRAGSTIYNAIKDKGTCTFYAPAGIDDSPSIAAIRGMQLVGQNNIGMGIVIDVAGKVYSFYYNLSNTSIIWTQMPTQIDKNRWDAGQLSKITADDGRLFYRGSAETTDYNTLTQTGMYLIYNAGVNAPPSFNLVFLLVMSYGNTLVQIAYESVYGKQTYFRFRKSDSETWTNWEKQITSSDLGVTWISPLELDNGWKQFSAAQPIQYKKNILGEVEIIGAIRDGTLGDLPVFVLPKGFRPKQATLYVGIASSIGTPGVPQFHRTLITTDGRVCVQSSSNSVNPTEFIAFGIKFSTI
ncbi:pyocin knob domain-containing protein [Bacillus sp. NPDC077027]|uniref:pyocin knob domain-containing protein n=1 Tax=Bacillus sp. NPDC077027 TaxID=3390548 RepID=UPI003D064365